MEYFKNLQSSMLSEAERKQNIQGRKIEETKERKLAKWLIALFHVGGKETSELLVSDKLDIQRYQFLNMHW